MKNIAQKGRSMVEMLGVLAIVGVLSVGAIAGYSKAMFKYKLNKQADSYRHLLFEAMKISKQVDYTKLTSSLDILSLLEQTNSIPNGYKKSKIGSTTGYDDIFGNRAWVVATTAGNGALGTYIYPSDHGHEMCQNLTNVAIENASDIYYFTVDKKVVEDQETSYETLDKYYGDNHCSRSVSWQKCLRDVKLENIETLCHHCVDVEVCRLYIYWKV